MTSGPFLSSVAMRWSGFSTCRPSTSWMSRAKTRRALLVDADDVRLRLGGLEDDLLQVEDDVGHVLDDVADGRELVQRAVDLGRP